MANREEPSALFVSSCKFSDFNVLLLVFDCFREADVVFRNNDCPLSLTFHRHRSRRRHFCGSKWVRNNRTLKYLASQAWYLAHVLRKLSLSFLRFFSRELNGDVRILRADFSLASTVLKSGKRRDSLSELGGMSVAREYRSLRHILSAVP